MAGVTYEDVLHLAEKLTPEEQKALIARLEAEIRQREAGYPSETRTEFEQDFGLLIFDVGTWPAELTLRREDE